MITRTALHTLKAAAFLAGDAEQQFHGAGEIARLINAPANYLGKLMQTLAREGILISQKGIRGGFKLARPARSITLYEVVDPIEHLSRFSGCFLGREECSEKHPCALHEQWADVRTRYVSMLRDFTLEDLARHHKQEPARP